MADMAGIIFSIPPSLGRASWWWHSLPICIPAMQAPPPGRWLMVGDVTMVKGTGVLWWRCGNIMAKTHLKKKNQVFFIFRFVIFKVHHHQEFNVLSRPKMNTSSPPGSPWTKPSIALWRHGLLRLERISSRIHWMNGWGKDVMVVVVAVVGQEETEILVNKEGFTASRCTPKNPSFSPSRWLWWLSFSRKNST